jgi:hypothetical protein
MVDPLLADFIRPLHLTTWIGKQAKMSNARLGSKLLTLHDRSTSLLLLSLVIFDQGLGTLMRCGALW